MPGNEFPRVLFMTPHAFNKVTGTGITFTNLFAGWPRDRIAVIHDDDQPASDEICTAFYRVGRHEIRKWGGRLTSRNVHPSAVSGQGPARRTPLRNLVRKTIFGDGLPQSGHLSPRLEEWIRSFRPDVIFTILGSIGFMELIEKVQDRFRLPLVVHMMDDWPSVQFRRGLLGPAQRKRLLGLVGRLVDRATLRMGICDAMCEAFGSRYGVPFVPFQNTVDVTKWRALARDPATVNNPLRVVYAGSVLANAQLDSLADCAQAVASLAAAGVGIRLDIHSPDFLVELHRDRLAPHPAVRIRPPLTDDDEFFSTLAAADILLMPSNFDAESVRFIRYSMPTRVPAYLVTGTPILVYGSADTAQVDYARAAGWGLVVDRRGVSGVEQALRRLTEDLDLRRNLTAAAMRTAADRHDAQVVRGRFQDALRRSCNAPASERPVEGRGESGQ